MGAFTTRSLIFPLLLALAQLPACQSGSSSGGNDDTDTETGSDTVIDTEWDGGPLTDCVGEPSEDEVWRDWGQPLSI